MARIAINGFGRIGRLVFRRIIDSFPKELQIAAINDVAENPEILVHLLRHDSNYGEWKRAIRLQNRTLFVGNTEIQILTEKDPKNLPWRNLEVDVVLECTGRFTSYDGAKTHLERGAQYVIISAPSKNPDKIPEFVLGVNENEFDPEKHKIVDIGSCTTNCLAPVMKVLADNFGIIEGFMITTHAYTADQRLVDAIHSDLRRARSAAFNIIPTTTGAARAIGNVIEELQGKLDGLAIRVPVSTVSLLAVICMVRKRVTIEKVNNAFRRAAKNNLKEILRVEEEELVSTDFIGDPHSAIVDASLTNVIGKLVLVFAWYDNEWAYACRLADFATFISKQIS